MTDKVVMGSEGGEGSGCVRLSAATNVMDGLLPLSASRSVSGKGG